MQHKEAIIEKSTRVFQKLKNKMTIRSSYPTTVYVSQGNFTEISKRYGQLCFLQWNPKMQDVESDVGPLADAQKRSRSFEMPYQASLHCED